MAKKNKPNIVPLYEGKESIDDFFDLLRAVVNGDKQATEQLRTLLDIIEVSKPNIKDLSPDGEKPMGDRNPGELTLKRDAVQEYHLRIKLNHIEMKIWRELKVPSDLCLDVLAHILIDVMGWTGEHLYGFRYKDAQYSIPNEFCGGPFSSDCDITKYTLSDLLKEKGERMKFDYDYGDGWEHDVWVKAIREYGKDEPHHIQFVKGFGACPPEDCGGVWGYEELIELTKKKRKTSEDKERLDWYEMTEEYCFNPDDCFEEDLESMMLDWDEELNGIGK